VSNHLGTAEALYAPTVAVPPGALEHELLEGAVREVKHVPVPHLQEVFAVSLPQMVQSSPCVAGRADSLTVPLREEAILNLDEFHGCRAIFVVVGHVIYPIAYGIAPHQPSIVGLQQFGRLSQVPHPRSYLD
jgi:hypothetical protein